MGCLNRWVISMDWDPESHLVGLIKSLILLPKLKHLDIGIEWVGRTGLKLLPPLHRFQDLYSLRIHCKCSMPPEFWLNELGRAAQRSPGLSRFETEVRDPRRTMQPLQAILGNASRPKLTHLHLSTHDPTPHGGPLDPCLIANLRCLDLTGSPTNTTTQGHSIWAALRNARTCLSSLSVICVEEATGNMFDYLRSYSGLSKLKIARNFSPDDSAGQVFWNEVVPNHKDSLVELDVSSSYDGPFCYGPLAASAIRKCTSLRKLALSLGKVDPAWVSGRIGDLRYSQRAWDLRCWPDVVCTQPHITVRNNHIWP